MALSLDASRAAAVSAPSIAASPASPRLDAQVRGRDPSPLDIDLAHMAQDVYDPRSAGVAGWRRLGADELQQAGIDPASLEDPSTGFRAALYTRGDGGVTLAFAGSNDLPDWLNNLEQGVGLDAAQYGQAVSLAKEAKLAFGDNLVITGHSLGGGLASAAALATGSAAVTFNAAGLSDATMHRFGLDPAAARAAADAGEVRRYAVDGDILTGLQEHTPGLSALMPDAVGHELHLAAPPPKLPDRTLADWLVGIPLKHQIDLGLQELARPVQLHLMDAVLQSLQSHALH